MRTITPFEIYTHWRDRYEWDRETIINGERQLYLPKQHVSSVSPDNNLRLTATRGETQINNVTQPYGSSVFISLTGDENQQLVKAGDFVEITAKLPKGAGLWPAFWLLRADKVWAKTEIDFMEGLQDVQDGNYHVAHHSHVDGDGTYQKLGETIETGIDLTESFNRYGVELFEDHVEFFFNGVQVAEVQLHEHEHNLEYYILVNLAVAGIGTWAGVREDQYDWDMDDLIIKSIVISDETDTVDTTLAGIVSEIDTDPSVYMFDSMVEELYDTSPRVSKIFYRLARRFGGLL